MNEVDPKEYISTYSTELDLSEVVEAEAYRIIDVSNESGIISGESPSVVAAASIYTASILCDDRKSQKEVADVANVIETTIDTIYQKQIRIMGLVYFEREKELTEMIQKSINEALEGKSASKQEVKSEFN